MAPKTQTVELAIVGCGYMGKTGAEAALIAAPALAAEGIDLRLQTAIDPDRTKRDAIRELLQSRGWQEAAMYKHWEEAIPRLEGASANPLLLYDATPTRLHYSHLESIEALAQNGSRLCAYLGEKPLFLDPNQLKGAAGIRVPIYCDLIEAENPVFKAMRRYIIAHQPHIRTMWFWRAGSTGIKWLAGHSRNGVQGGALLDKSPHDLSLSINLLGARGVRGRVVGANTHFLIPGNVQRGSGLGRMPSKTVLNAVNRSVDELVWSREKRDFLPADGVTSVEVEWTSPAQDEAIKGHYLFSWLGVGFKEAERFFREKVDSLRLDLQRFIHRDLSIDAARIEEIRIGIIECDDRTIVCNLLGKKDGTRFCRVIHNSGAVEDLEMESEILAHERKQTELSGIFAAVVESMLAADNDHLYVGRTTSLETHRMLLDAQDLLIIQGMEEYRDIARAVDAAYGAIQAKFDNTKE